MLDGLSPAVNQPSTCPVRLAHAVENEYENACCTALCHMACRMRVVSAWPPIAVHACRRDERYDWTDDQIWDVITNDGKSVDPFVMLNAPTFKTLNPLCMPDWAGQGIEYVDDMEDWISQQGLWMTQEEYASASAHRSQSDDDDEVMVRTLHQAQLFMLQHTSSSVISAQSIPYRFRTVCRVIGLHMPLQLSRLLGLTQHAGGRVQQGAAAVSSALSTCSLSLIHI